MPAPIEDEMEGTPAHAAPDRQRLALLYRDHAPRLIRRVRLRLGSSEEASDLVHDAFAKLLGASALDRVRDPGAFLNRIIRNLLIDRSRRRAARAPHVTFEADLDIPVAPQQGEAIELEETRRRYRELVESLPCRMREVFLLHRLGELSYSEIAIRLGISVRTVEWHIAEAILRIGRGLDKE